MANTLKDNSYSRFTIRFFLPSFPNTDLYKGVYQTILLTSTLLYNSRLNICRFSQE